MHDALDARTSPPVAQSVSGTRLYSGRAEINCWSTFRRMLAVFENIFSESIGSPFFPHLRGLLTIDFSSPARPRAGGSTGLRSARLTVSLINMARSPRVWMKPGGRKRVVCGSVWSWVGRRGSQSNARSTAEQRECEETQYIFRTNALLLPTLYQY